MKQKSIDTQSDEYYQFKRIRSERAKYFLQDVKGISCYKSVRMLFGRYANPILKYDGYKLCDHISLGSMTEETWNECVKVYNNAVARRKRLKQRVNELDGYLYFVTLTFTDEHLKMTSLSRRNHIINPFLKLMREKYGLTGYVGTKEYGRKTDREHYHFIMAFSDALKGDFGTIKRRWGREHEYLKNTVIEQNYPALVDVSPLHSEDKDLCDKVSSYLGKVAGYLDKDTNKTQHLIYSSSFVRKKKTKLEVDENGFMVFSDDDMEWFDTLFV